VIGKKKKAQQHGNCWAFVFERNVSAIAVWLKPDFLVLRIPSQEWGFLLSPS